MKCSVCGSDNLEGSAYCEDCGSRLAMTPAAPVMAPPAPEPVPATVAPAPVPTPVAEAPAPAPAAEPVAASNLVLSIPVKAPVSAEMPAAEASSAVCPACGATNAQGSAFCEDCGASLSAAPAPVAVSAPAPAPAPSVSVGVAPIAVARPRLVVSGSSVEFPLDREVMLLGRNSPADGIFPEIDLTEVDTGSYISRRHGRITRQATAFLYEDMGSSNGSFINGNKLVAKTQIELHDGDTLRLGRTEMCFRI
ncbi:FHA domain-containing protein [bacterium]|nr:FHA domain-containing protein [bacterium]